MSLTVQYLITGLIAVTIGYALFLFILKILPKKLCDENLRQKEDVLKEASKQRDSILGSANDSAAETLQLMQDELEEDIQESMEALKLEEQDLESREEFLSTEQSRVDRLLASLNKKNEQVSVLESEYNIGLVKVSESKQKLISGLEKAAECDSQHIKEKIKNKIIDFRQLECQKTLRLLMEELDLSARKRAERILNRTLARYTPDFTWPKSINTVEISDKNILEELQNPNCTLLQRLKALSEAEIKIVTPEEENRQTAVVRLVSGFGPYREAAKNTLIEMIRRGKNSWGQAEQVFDGYKKNIEQECRRLGNKAVNELKLGGIHPEIQMLIGSLYWRTSYRQNQWHHTVEVSMLAGIIAHELGIDSDAAKRVGLLHDIGKAIDYRIEGSHAVISGDYADRFGEEKVICDTVMSHHSDLIVETPLAYVLRVADTLSGARPGARVNLEEGYQIRLDAIAESIRSFQGISDFAIMNGGREVHVQVNHKKVKENEVRSLTEAIARKIEADVAFPGQIKVMVSRQFESVTVA
ncbi:MAG: Rnase Y domain-containing protein [Bdellovibrionota bacterium]